MRLSEWPVSNKNKTKHALCVVLPRCEVGGYADRLGKNLGTNKPISFCTFCVTHWLSDYRGVITLRGRSWDSLWVGGRSLAHARGWKGWRHRSGVHTLMHHGQHRDAGNGSKSRHIIASGGATDFHEMCWKQEQRAEVELMTFQRRSESQSRSTTPSFHFSCALAERRALRVQV